jgi:cyclophilin family peptidyl-prolyl cis-trans isomerase
MKKNNDHRNGLTAAGIRMLSLIVFIVAFTQHVRAQTTEANDIDAESKIQQEGEQVAPPVEIVSQEKLNLKKYQELVQEIKESKSKITQLLTTVSPGDREGTSRTIAEVDRLKLRIAELEAQSAELVLLAYVEAPVEAASLAPLAARTIRLWLGDSVTATEFQPQKALDVCEQIIANGTKNPGFYLFAAQAAYATQDYEKSIAYINEAKNLGGTINEAYIVRVQTVLDNWKQEQALREQDAQANLPQVQFETSLGKITIELFEDNAPQAVNNFVRLCEDGFYTGRKFFFVKNGAIAITGCPQDDGSGNAGYYLPDESKRPDARRHFVGSVSLFHDQPGTDSSQFSIAHQAIPERDNQFTVIGRVIEGLDVFYRFPSTGSPLRSNLPGEDTNITIDKVVVLRKREHPYEATEKIPLTGDVPANPAGGTPAQTLPKDQKSSESQGNQSGVDQGSQGSEKGGGR